MRKINNKGLTLIELIVSFAIVGVAIVYFYQTINTVSKLYSTAKTNTNDYAKSTYALRLLDAKLDAMKETYHSSSEANIDLTNSNAQQELNDFCEKVGVTCVIYQPLNKDTETDPDLDRIYHYYAIKIIVKSGTEEPKLFRRATIRKDVGTKTETYRGNAKAEMNSKGDKYDLSTNGGETLHNVEFSESNEYDEQELTNTTSIRFVRDNFVEKPYEEKNIFSKSGTVWRKFMTIPSNQLQTWKTNDDPTKPYYGLYYSAKKISDVNELVSVPNLQVGDIILSNANANNKDLAVNDDGTVLKCQGLIIQSSRIGVCTNTLIISFDENKIKDKAISWFNKLAESYRYSPYKFVITDIKKNWIGEYEVSYNRYSYTSDTFYQYEKIYNLYKYDD